MIKCVKCRVILDGDRLHAMHGDGDVDVIEASDVVALGEHCEEHPTQCKGEPLPEFLKIYRDWNLTVGKEYWWNAAAVKVTALASLSDLDDNDLAEHDYDYGVAFFNEDGIKAG